jgi:hypothetical protein
MSLRFQLYRSATGRQHKRCRTVRALLRPLAIHGSFAHPSRAQGRAIAYGTALAMVLFITIVACALPRVQAHFVERFHPGASSAARLLGGARPGAAWSRLRMWSPRLSLSEMGLGGGGGGSYCAVPLGRFAGAARSRLEGACMNFWSWRETHSAGASGAPSKPSPRLEPARPFSYHRAPIIPLFPTYSTMLHTSQAEARALSQTLRSSAAREALDQTYQHALLPLINPVLAVQQLCQHGGYPRVICADSLALRRWLGQSAGRCPGPCLYPRRIPPNNPFNHRTLSQVGTPVAR